MGQLWEWLHQMMDIVRAGAMSDLGWWSYGLLVLLVAVEGPLSTLLGAAAAAAGLMDVRLVFLATVVGNVGGDVGWYLIGRMGLSEPLLRYGGWLGLRPRHLARLERAMQDHAVKLLLLSKVAYGLIVPTLVATGMARVAWRRWFPVVFVAETVWSFLLVWIGFHAAWVITEFERGLRTYGILALVGVVIVIMFVMRRRVREQSKELDPLRRVLLLEEDPLPPVNGVVRPNGEPVMLPVLPPRSQELGAGSGTVTAAQVEETQDEPAGPAVR